MINTRNLLPQGLHDPAPGKSEKRRYSPGDVLFREGDASDGLYIVQSGRLRVYATNASGREIVYNTLGPGELFGELSLDGGTRSASVSAMTESECIVLSNAAAHELMRSRPEFADHVMAKLIARARQATQLTRSIVLEGVPERVMALLEQSAISDGTVRRIPFTSQQDIADRIGASREMVNKVVRELVRAGHLHKDASHRMTILKPFTPGRR